MTTLLWAYAMVGRRSPEMVRTFSLIFHEKLNELTPPQIGTITWSVAKLGYEGPASQAPEATQLFDAAAQAVNERLDSFTHHTLAHTAWAFASADHAAPEMFDAIAKVAIEQSHKLTTGEMTMLLWAHAKAGHWSPPLLATWPKHFLSKRAAYKPSELAIGLWAHSSMGATIDADTFKELDAALAERLSQFEDPNLVTVAWSCAVADHDASALFARPEVVERWVARDSRGQMTQSEMTQLHQWQLWLNERDASWPRLPPPLAKKCHTAMALHEGQPSALQRLVELALKELLGLEPRSEVTTAQGYSVDAIVTVDGVEVAVEVDGPTHFVGRTQKPSGSTVLKRRQLRSAGWALFSVPFFEWLALRDDEARKSYLSNGLRSAIATMQEQPNASSPSPTPRFDLRQAVRNFLG